MPFSNYLELNNQSNVNMINVNPYGYVSGILGQCDDLIIIVTLFQSLKYFLIV